MKKVIAVLALALAASSAAQAQNVVEQADRIEPVFDTQTRTECTAAPAGGGWLGQALGGVLGAGIGSQIGKGSGQAAAAAAGAVLGAQAGAAVTNNSQQPAGQTCRQLVDRELVGYSIVTQHGRAVFLPIGMVRGMAQ